jgi:hypothetical protein
MPETGGLNGRLAARLDAILRATPNLMTVLELGRGLDLPDWLIVSGAIYQPVLNHLTGRPLDFGIKDYDLAYFDASDLSYEAEGAVIQRAAAAFDPPLRDKVEVRNQARVHLWFEDHYGEAFAPRSCSAEALSRFTAPLFAVGAGWSRTAACISRRHLGWTICLACACGPTPRIRPGASRARRSGRWLAGRRSERRLAPIDVAVADLHPAIDPGQGRKAEPGIEAVGVAGGQVQPPKALQVGMGHQVSPLPR